MLRLIRVLLRSFIAALRSRRELALENLALRHQLSVLHAASRRRLTMTDLDRASWIALRRMRPDPCSITSSPAMSQSADEH